MPVTIGTNKFGLPTWIVNPTAGLGTHQTITSAMASASAGDSIYLTPATYNESFTITPGVNIFANPALQSTGTADNLPVINGTITMSGNGSSTLSGFEITAPSGSAISITNNSSALTLLNMSIGTSGVNAFSMTHGQLYCYSCTGQNVLWSISSGTLYLYDCDFNQFQSGGSSTCTCSGTSSLFAFNSNFSNGINLTSSAAGTIFNVVNCNFLTSNLTAVTIAGGSGSTQYMSGCVLQTGTASAVSVSVGDVLNMSRCTVQSSNANAITGAGTLQYSNICFTGTSSTINTTTLVNNPVSAIYTPSITFDNTNLLSNYVVSSWTPTIRGSTTAGATTYTTQIGSYTRIGNRVFLQADMTVTATTGTGNMQIGGLPFAINASNGNVTGGVVAGGASLSLGGGGSQFSIQGAPGASVLSLVALGNNHAVTNIAMTNSTFSVNISINYSI